MLVFFWASLFLAGVPGGHGSVPWRGSAWVYVQLLKTLVVTHWWRTVRAASLTAVPIIPTLTYALPRYGTDP